GLNPRSGACALVVPAPVFVHSSLPGDSSPARLPIAERAVSANSKGAQAWQKEKQKPRRNRNLKQNPNQNQNLNQKPKQDQNQNPKQNQKPSQALRTLRPSWFQSA